MVNWMNMEAMQMSRLLAEDVYAPELRNPRHSAIRSKRRFFQMLRSFMF